MPEPSELTPMRTYIFRNSHADQGTQTQITAEIATRAIRDKSSRSAIANVTAAASAAIRVVTTTESNSCLRRAAFRSGAVLIDTLTSTPTGARRRVFAKHSARARVRVGRAVRAQCSATRPHWFQYASLATNT